MALLFSPTFIRYIPDAELAKKSEHFHVLRGHSRKKNTIFLSPRYEPGTEPDAFCVFSSVILTTTLSDGNNSPILQVRNGDRWSCVMILKCKVHQNRLEGFFFLITLI